MGLWFSFKDLKPGERFRFHYNPVGSTRPPRYSPVYTKARNGWYRDDTGKAFWTGHTSAVVHATDTTEPPT